MPPIRVFLADSHTLFREGLAMLVGRYADMIVVGQAATPGEALLQAPEAAPDIVITGFGDSDVTVDAVAGLVDRLPGIRVIVLDQEKDSDPRPFLAAGASGVGLQRWTGDDLASAIRAVSRGAVYLDQQALQGLLGLGRARGEWGEERSGPAGTRDLSPREREVVALIATGKTNQEAAAALSVSVNTIHTHRTRAMEKLSLRNRAELVRYAVRHGLVPG